MSVAIPITQPAISGTLITADHDHSRVGHAALHTEGRDQAPLRSRAKVRSLGADASALNGTIRASAEAQP